MPSRGASTYRPIFKRTAISIDAFVASLRSSYADCMRTTGTMLRMVRTPIREPSPYQRGGRFDAVGDNVDMRLPHLGTLCDPSIETPERRLRPGEGYDMHSNNGLSRKGTTG